MVPPVLGNPTCRFYGGLYIQYNVNLKFYTSIDGSLVGRKEDDI
jgi:hypothetical protein